MSRLEVEAANVGPPEEVEVRFFFSLQGRATTATAPWARGASPRAAAFPPPPTPACPSRWATALGCHGPRAGAPWGAASPRRERAPCRSVRSPRYARGWAPASSWGSCTRTSFRDVADDRSEPEEVPPGRHRSGAPSAAGPEAARHALRAPAGGVGRGRSSPRLEDEKRRATALLALIQPLTHGPHLLGGDLVLVLARTEAPEIHRCNPAVALEAQLGDELVGPAGDDRWAGRPNAGKDGSRSRARGCTQRVAAGPHAHVHGVHRGGGAVLLEGVGGDELPARAWASIVPWLSAA